MIFTIKYVLIIINAMVFTIKYIIIIIIIINEMIFTIKSVPRDTPAAQLLQSRTSRADQVTPPLTTIVRTFILSF